MKCIKRFSSLVILFASISGYIQAQTAMTPNEIESIASDAYIYGYPIVKNYKTLYEFSVDKDSPQFKAPLNEIYHAEELASPKDTTVITPNSDTPYSMLWADLRAEPLVLTVPQIEKNRYYALQFIDLYTYNFDYVGTATTGNEAGKYILAGPSWRGGNVKGIDKVIISDTDFAFVIYRTQLFNPEDWANVKKIQAGYTVEPLSKFLGTTPPPVAPKIDFPDYTDQGGKNVEFYNYLNFVLQFSPVVKDDVIARAKFASIGIGSGKPFNAIKFPVEVQKIFMKGIENGSKLLDEQASHVTNASNLFGTREYLKNNYLNRALGAKLGIYGNSEKEAYYYALTKDASGNPLNTAVNKYTIHFSKDKLPPVKAFWSITLYDAKTQLLVKNPLNRYLINSTMLPSLKQDPDGGITIYIQKDSPGAEKESNWLPAKDGPIDMVLRAYWPEEAILEGQWEPPHVEKSS